MGGANSTSATKTTSIGDKYDIEVVIIFRIQKDMDTEGGNRGRRSGGRGK